MSKKTLPINYSLSNAEIEKYLGDKCKIIVYEDLEKIKNIENYMSNILFLVILYQTEKDYGHWTVLIKNDLINAFSFFDSYGIKPDMQLLDMPMIIRNGLGQTFPHLSVLLFNSKRKIFYNHNKLQKLANNVSTCGKWVVLRCLMPFLEDDLFADFVQSINPKQSLDNNLQYIWKNYLQEKNNYFN